MSEDTITPQAIIDIVKEQIVLPDGGWERVESKAASILSVIWQINLDTELEET